MKHVFIFDPGAFAENQLSIEQVSKGRLQQDSQEVVQDRIGMFFRTQEKPVWSIQQSRFPRDSLGIIQREIDEFKDNHSADNPIRIYAIGGDDVLFDCLNGVAGVPNVELAAVPYGRSHDFIRTFGRGKSGRFRDFPALIKSSTIPTDIIDTGNNYALIGCSVGFAPTATVKTRTWKKNRRVLSRIFGGLFSSFSKIAVAFNREVSSRHYDITIDDKDYSGNYSLINIANCAYYDGNKVCVADALPNDGLLDVALLKAASPLRTLAAMGTYSRRKIPSNCVRIQAKKISIKSDSPVWIQLDSEFYQDSNITFEVMPGAVQIATVDNLTYQTYQKR